MNTRLMYAVLAASGLWANGAAAQKSSGATTERKTETVVIKQDDAHPQTVIQIQNGTVVVNGDTVATAGDRSSKKIIIDRESDAPMARSGGGNMFGIPNAGARKARLGVLTDPALSTGGAYVKEVQPGSPAEAAGLKAGDKITKVDGSTIADSKDLVETISTHDPEDTVRLTYLRGTATRTTTAKLESPQDEGGARSFGFGGPGMDLSDLGRLFGNGGDMFGNKSETATPKLGLTVEDRADGSGVRILDVKPEGAAAKAGLKADDIILELGSNKLASIDELQRTVRTLQGEEVAIRYQRSGKTATAKITIPKVLRKRDM